MNHIYVTDLEGEYSHYFGEIKGYEGGFVVEAEGGAVHYSYGYFQSIAVLDKTMEEFELDQANAILSDLEGREEREEREEAKVVRLGVVGDD